MFWRLSPRRYVVSEEEEKKESGEKKETAREREKRMHESRNDQQPEYLSMGKWRKRSFVK
jgi:hypothetical protein